MHKSNTLTLNDADTKMEDSLIKRNFSKLSDGAYKYGFITALKKKHQISKFYRPTADWEHGWNYTNSTILDSYKVAMSYKLNFIVTEKKKKEKFKELTSNKIILDSLPFYYYCRNEFDNYYYNILNKNNDNNLLVFPAKMSFSGKSIDEINLRKKYFDFIKSLENSFEKIIICIPYSDSLHDDYKNLIKKFKFNYVTGAHPKDHNSYDRILQILSLAKTVTTNNLGSILVYSALVKKKISISGPHYASDRSFEAMALPKKFKYNINHIKDELIRVESKDFLKKNYKNLIYSSPIHSKEMFEWGTKEGGVKYFVSSKKACEKLGFNAISQLGKIFKKFYYAKN